MPTTYDALLRLREQNVPYQYQERDSQLYAVSIGMGRDPLNEAELHYLYENYPLRVVPTQAVVVARQKLIWNVGLDVGQFLHGEQRLTIHRPLPPAASLLADAWVSEVYDKGPGKGCILQLEGVVRNTADNEPLFSWMSLIVARGDGGVGGPGAKVPAAHAMPTRKPDLVVTTETRPDQGLLYRLNGDRNLCTLTPRSRAMPAFVSRFCMAPAPMRSPPVKCWSMSAITITRGYGHATCASRRRFIRVSTLRHTSGRMVTQSHFGLGASNGTRLS